MSSKRGDLIVARFEIMKFDDEKLVIYRYVKIEPKQCESGVHIEATFGPHEHSPFPVEVGSLRWN